MPQSLLLPLASATCWPIVRSGAAAPDRYVPSGQHRRRRFAAKQRQAHAGGSKDQEPRLLLPHSSLDPDDVPIEPQRPDGIAAGESDVIDRRHPPHRHTQTRRSGQWRLRADLHAVPVELDWHGRVRPRLVRAEGRSPRHQRRDEPHPLSPLPAPRADAAQLGRLVHRRLSVSASTPPPPDIGGG